MSVNKEVLQESNILSPKQFDDFLIQLECVPGKRSPLNGLGARLCFQFMEDTGCRVSETISIKKKDLDFKTRILTVTNPKTEQRCKCSRWKNKNEYSNIKILEYADTQCIKCHGKGKWKKPQRTTFTPRIYSKLVEYCKYLEPDEYLFPITRQSLFNWGKQAGKLANLYIFQQKDERKIDGIFLHLFRELCSKRVKFDARDDPFRDELVQCKLRHSYDVMADRYTKIDINYLLNWEAKIYKQV